MFDVHESNENFLSSCKLSITSLIIRLILSLSLSLSPSPSPLPPYSCDR